MPPQSAPNAPVTGWAIEYQQPSIDLGPDGRAVSGMKIGFVTRSGVHAFVFLSQSAYSVDNARAAIAAKAKQIEDVHGLTG